MVTDKEEEEEAMAASATTTIGISPQNYICSTNNNSPEGNSCSLIRFPVTRKLRRKLVVVRKSGAAETTESEEAPVEVRKDPASLISALNVEKALRGIAITDADHYGRLGLRRGCSYDQVLLAYKKKVEEVTNQGLEEEELAKNFELLKESYSILSSVEERRLYDWSLSRSENPDKYMWPFEVDITQTPVDGTPPPQEEEDVGPTRFTGYFILVWIVLSFILSIVLNTR